MVISCHELLSLMGKTHDLVTYGRCPSVVFLMLEVENIRSQTSSPVIQRSWLGHQYCGSSRLTRVDISQHCYTYVVLYMHVIFLSLVETCVHFVCFLLLGKRSSTSCQLIFWIIHLI